MNRQMKLLRDLEDELRRVSKLAAQLANDKGRLPGGSLMQRSDGRVFHVIEHGGNKMQIRMDKNSTEDQKTMALLKYKRYIKAALPVLQEWIKQIKCFIKHVKVYDPFKIQENLKAQYHGLNGIPVFLEGDINPEVWGNQKSPPMYEEGLIYPSENGLMTRSKSEAQIASKYESLGWKIVYEPVIKLPDGRILRPDFAVLHPEKRKVVYHEHLGMMDDPDYAINAIKKLDDYASVGIVQGDNLVVTVETKAHPLTFQAISEVIKKIEAL